MHRRLLDDVLGRHDDASKSFAKAVSLTDGKVNAALSWEHRLEWNRVCKESEALIRPNGP